MYLNGRGINQRTRELTDAVWDKLLHAIFGSTLAVAGPIITCGLILLMFSLEAPVLPEQKIGAFIVSLSCVVIGVLIARPWFTAKRALDTHTENMRRETEQRGKGWASN